AVRVLRHAEQVRRAGLQAGEGVPGGLPRLREAPADLRILGRDRVADQGGAGAGMSTTPGGPRVPRGGKMDGAKADGAKAPAAPRRRKPLGEVLIDAGLITREQLTAAIAQQKMGKDRLGRVLITIVMRTEKDIAKAIVQQHNMHYVDLDDFNPADPHLRT